MHQKAYDSVWDALEDTPEQAAAMRLRSDLMIAVQEGVRGWSLTQMAAAERLGVTQPRLSNLMRGKVNRFSLDALVELASRAGLTVRMEVDRVT